MDYLTDIETAVNPAPIAQSNFEILDAAISLPLQAVPLVGLTGGGSTKLDGILTPGLTLGSIVIVWNGSTAQPYRLRAGTDAEAAPWIIRPDDYAASTNERVWEMAGSFGVAATVNSGDTDLAEAAFALVDFGSGRALSLALPLPGTYQLDLGLFYSGDGINRGFGQLYNSNDAAVIWEDSYGCWVGADEGWAGHVHRVTIAAPKTIQARFKCATAGTIVGDCCHLVATRLHA